MWMNSCPLSTFHSFAFAGMFLPFTVPMIP